MVKNRFYRFIRATWRPFATFLHPLRVEGLENLPKDQPVLLCANQDRKSTRLNSSHKTESRMPSSA